MSNSSEFRTIDLTYENQLIKAEFFKEFEELYDSNMLMIGPALDQLEKKLCIELGTNYTSLTGAGTMSLQVAVKALGLQPGDEVIVPANTFFASATGPVNAGAKIKLADVDPETFNINSKTIDKVFSKKTKAIVAVHLYGNIYDPVPLKEFGVPIIEDASHAFSGTLGERKVGSLGTISVLSGGPIKGFGGIGHGGFMGYDDENLKEYIEAFINNGQKNRHIADIVGHNFRMDSVNALFFLKKLSVWKNIRSRRRAVRDIYDEAFNNAGISYR